jgi:putative PIN family toxin of toxin-antitoxin system
MNVVIDTNVLVSSLRSTRGTSRKLISIIPSRKFTPVMTVPLYMEALDVLTRPGMLPNVYTVEDIHVFCRYLLSQSRRKEVYYLWRSLLPDPKDDMVLEAAVAGQAAHIITFNTGDFRPAQLFGVKAITPLQFLKQIGEIP